MAKIVLVLIAALAAITLAEAGGGRFKFGSGIDGLKNKLKRGFGTSAATGVKSNYGAYGGLGTGAYGKNQYATSDSYAYENADKYKGSKPYGAYGDKYNSYSNKYSPGHGHGLGHLHGHGHGHGHHDASAALADAHVSGDGAAVADAAAYGRNSDAAATAVGGHGSTGSYGHNVGHGHQEYDDDYAYNQGGAYGKHGSGHGGAYGGSAYGGGAYGGNAYGGHTGGHGLGNVVLPPPIPVKPSASLDTYKSYTRPSTRYAPVGVGGAAASSAVSGVGSAAASASSASAGGSGHGSGVASGMADTHYNSYPVSHESSAVSGTYGNSDNGRESSAYQRATEHLQEHEDGHKDDNHFYKSSTYGKADDENKHEAFNKNYEDVEQTPFVYRSKKSNENYLMDYNKNRRETGSGVLAKDKHSSGFNRNTNRFVENVDQKHSREGDGIIEHSNHATASNFDDGDEEIYDSDGFGAPAHMHGPGAHGGGSAAASSAVTGGAASSSAAVAA